jgi:hypothetical protein
MTARKEIAAALMLLGCEPSVPLPFSPLPSAPIQTVPTASTVAVENERLLSAHGESTELRIGLNRRVAAMQAALRRDDASAFADAVVYPAYVNTRSGCSAILQDQERFRRHFGVVVDSSVRKALLDTKETGAWAGDAISIAGDRIWFPVGIRGFVFNTHDVWSLPGLECWHETPRELPASLPLTWRVKSTCWAEGEARSSTPITRTKLVHIQPTTGTVTLTTAAGASATCRLDRVSDKDIGRSPTSLLHCGPWSSGLTLSLDCRKAGESYVVWMLYDDGQLQVSGANNVIVTLEPVAPKGN